MTGVVVGFFTGVELLVPIEIAGPNGTWPGLTAAVDTAYSEYLSLPAAVISRLGLIATSSGPAILADGTKILTRRYLADLLWLGSQYTIEVEELPGTPLIGMGLLRGCRLTADVTPGGPVRIEPLSPASAATP